MLQSFLGVILHVRPYTGSVIKFSIQFNFCMKYVRLNFDLGVLPTPFHFPLHLCAFNQECTCFFEVGRWILLVRDLITSYRGNKWYSRTKEKSSSVHMFFPSWKCRWMCIAPCFSLVHLLVNFPYTSMNLFLIYYSSS